MVQLSKMQEYNQVLDVFVAKDQKFRMRRLAETQTRVMVEFSQPLDDAIYV